MMDHTMLPSARQEREMFIRELRVHWCWHRYMAAEIEFVAFAVKNGMPETAGRLWLAEAAGTAEGAADE
jgi:hypothetical protein